MKPTDEAKRLRDEINGIIADMVCDHQSDELTEEIINKVLDVVMGATPEGINGGAYEEDDYAGGWNHALNAYEDEIAKLRP